MSQTFTENDHPRAGDGKFSIKTSAEPSGVSLDAPVPQRRPELEGWPEHLPEPTVDFNIGEDGGVTTYVTVKDQGSFSLWTENPSTDRCDFQSYEDDFVGMDQDTVEQMQEWAEPKHLAIKSAVVAEMTAAANRVRLDVLRKVTGARQLPSIDDLEAMVGAAEQGHNPRHGELASVSLAARGILEEHPNAKTAELVTEQYDNGIFVEGIKIFDKNDVLMEEYSVNNDPACIVENLTELPANPHNSHWTEFAPDTDPYGTTIDVTAAAGWVPEH